MMFLDILNIPFQPVLALFGLEGVIIAAASAAASAASSIGVAGGLALGGAGVSAYMGIQQGNQAAKTANNAAKQAQNEAELEARRIETQNQYEQEQRLEERDLTLGKIRRSYGQSGLQMAGSPLQDQVTTTQNMTMDMLMAQYNTTEQTKAVRYQGAATANIYKQQGKAAKTAGYWNAGQSIMGGVSAYSQLNTPTSGMKLKTTQFGGSGKYGNALKTSNIGNSYSRNF